MPLAPSTRLGPYEMISPIGAGGMGEVYRARDTKLDREVAVKVLPSSLARDPAALARFEREAKAVAALSHPNILAVHDFGTSGDTTYAVMELLEGESLRQRLAEQRGRHQGGSRWVGTGGTSPFGAYGDHLEGVRILQDDGHRGSAVKVWDRREFKDFDGDAELGPRNIKLALRRLRRLAREGAAEELDLDGTIRSTADKGFIDILLRPERRNAVKVLLL